MSSDRKSRVVATWVAALLCALAGIGLHGPGKAGRWIAVVLFVLSAAFTVFAIMRTMALSAPQVALEISPATPQPGETLHLSWEVDAGDREVRSIELRLEGIRLTRPQTDQSATDVETVVFEEKVTVAEAAEARRGDVDLSIPADVASASAVGEGPMKWRVVTRLDVEGVHAVTESFVFTSVQ